MQNNASLWVCVALKGLCMLAVDQEVYPVRKTTAAAVFCGGLERAPAIEINLMSGHEMTVHVFRFLR